MIGALTRAIGSAGRRARDVPLWLALALAFAALSLANRDPLAPLSPFWFLEAPLFALLIALVWADRRSGHVARVATSRSVAASAYVALVWAFGMIYELTLTRDGTGIGGMHPGTFASFALAQGMYVPLACASLWVIRRFRFAFRDAFFFAAGVSLNEGLIFTGVLLATILSPQAVLAPLMFAYYATVYACFIALPLLIIDERLLWATPGPPRDHKVWRLIAGGFAAGLAINLLWGLVLAPLIEAALELPPNQPFQP